MTGQSRLTMTSETPVTPPETDSMNRSLHDGPSSTETAVTQPLVTPALWLERFDRVARRLAEIGLEEEPRDVVAAWMYVAARHPEWPSRVRSLFPDPRYDVLADAIVARLPLPGVDAHPDRD